MAISGCHHFVSGRQLGISERERQALLKTVYQPEAVGVQMSELQGHQTVRWREMAHPQTAVTVPLLPTGSSHSVQPLVAVRINTGPPVQMVLDTGAPVSVVDAGTALANRLMVIDPERMRNFYRGLGGDEETFFGMARQMTMGPELAFRNVLMAIRSAKYERKLGGMLTLATWEGNAIGLATLANFAFLTLDYPAKQATFSAGDFFPGPANPGTAINIPFKLEGSQVRIGLNLGGATNHPAMLDTGNDASIMISSNLVRELGWESLADHGKDELYVGLGGDMLLHSFRLPRVQLGTLTLTNVAAVRGPEAFGLVVGSHFLHQYRTTLDFRRKTLWLER